MALQEYHAKRRFKETPEPAGGRGPQAMRGMLRFVVQKHAASRLHYDFRLEWDGVLKSWAVPKGPSMVPGNKRLAVMVEDHPLEYGTFEGSIPEGNYGAGTVMVWDAGAYDAHETTTREESEEAMRRGLEQGKLHFALHGKKLRGEFTLVRMKGEGGKNWLLIKKHDAQALQNDVLNKDRSVQSRRSLNGIAREAAKEGRVWDSKRRSDAAMPRRIKPMLATLVNAPFDKPGWLFEVKWDGYRAMALVDHGTVELYSRNFIALTDRYQAVVKTLQGIRHSAILDGEVVALDAQGRSNFQLLQRYRKTGQGTLAYMVFDLLYLDGEDVRQQPLRRRKELLPKLLAKLPNVRFSEHIDEQGVAFFREAAKFGLEGIVAKNADSRYWEGQRSQEWLKIKTRQQQEVVIGGFTAPRGSRQQLGALVVGVYEGANLVGVGHVGGGFNTRSLDEVRKRLDPLVQDECPFKKKPKTNAPVTWVAPKLVCAVAFQEWTDDGTLRQPIFLGLRDDKTARSVTREEANPVAEIVAPKLTNLDKVYWPNEGYTKGDLLAYYREIATFILPYLRDRPLSLNRHPNGIKGPNFYQKNMARNAPPEWVKTYTIHSKSSKRDISYLICQDEPALLYMANLGCIEINPWHARTSSLDRPDYLVLDLDPEGVPFSEVVKVALLVRKVLEKGCAQCYCKTSGKTGLHLYIPLGARYESALARRFAEVLANIVHRRMPATTSIVRNPARRQHHVYLDYLQNGQGQTLAAAYSVRPVPGATVSTPLEWKEVRKNLDPGRFTIRTMSKRLDKVGDLWQPVLGEGVDLAKCLNVLMPLAASPWP